MERTAIRISQGKTHNKGVTLIEILIAALVLSIAIGGVLQAYQCHLQLSQTAKEIAIATTDARDMMEKIACTPFSNIIANFPDGVADGGGINNYATLVGGYTLDSEQITVDYPDPLAEPLEIIVSVQWLGPRGRQLSTSLSTFRTE